MRPEDEWRDLLDEDDDEEDEDEESEEKDKEGEASVLKGLLKARTIILSGEINKKLAEKISTLLLVMEVEGDGPIKVFIDSPGGDADAGYGILDMIRFVKSPVYTISNGLTASAGVIISLAAKPEHRFSLPNSRFLIHQNSCGRNPEAEKARQPAYRRRMRPGIRKGRRGHQTGPLAVTRRGPRIRPHQQDRHLRERAGKYRLIDNESWICTNRYHARSPGLDGRLCQPGSPV
jgi:ATP-dependent Clp endopeptidase proteolytic subunit ClpP